MDVMSHSGRQGWMTGLMDGAVASLEIVRKDARENLQRVPNHKLSREADERLSRAIHEIEELSTKLEKIASGEDANG